MSDQRPVIQGAHNTPEQVALASDGLCTTKQRATGKVPTETGF